MLEAGLVDQAAGLRKVAAPGIEVLGFALEPSQGAGWVAQVARGLCESGHRPVLLDASRGAVASAFGLKPRHDLIEMLQGELEFDDVSQPTVEGVHVLRADRGIEAFAASGTPAARLLDGFARLSHGFDLLLLAMKPEELACLYPPARTPVVGVPVTPAGLLEAYGWVKTLSGGFGFGRFACLMVGPEEEEARREHARFAAAAQRFLGVDACFAGSLPADRSGAWRDHTARARAARAVMRAAVAAHE